MSDLYLGDCREVRSVLADNSIDLIVTSPPYDDLRTYGGLSSWSFDVFKEVAAALADVLKPGGVVVWVVNDATVDGSESGTSFRQALYFKDNLKLKLHDTMIYAKTAVGKPDSVRYQNCFEYVFILSKGKPKTINLIRDRKNKSFGRYIVGSTIRQVDGSTTPSSSNGKAIAEFGYRWNIWEIGSANGKERIGHPAPFPLRLAEDHIKTWSNPGDIVLDPFAGSGTTLLAAKNTGREYVGIEQNPEYYEIIKARLGLK